jgi:hypothetical protein
MEKRAVTEPVMYYDYNTKEERQIGTLRRAHIEGMQKNFVPDQSVEEIIRGFRPCAVYNKYYFLQKDLTWKDVFTFLKLRIFRFFRIKSDVDKLFVKQNKDAAFSEWIKTSTHNSQWFKQHNIQ